MCGINGGCFFYRCTRVAYRLVSFTQNSNNIIFLFYSTLKKSTKVWTSIALLTSKPQKARNMDIKPSLSVFLVQTETSQGKQFKRPLPKDVLNSVKIQKYNVQTIGLYVFCKHLHPSFTSLKRFWLVTHKCQT